MRHVVAALCLLSLSGCGTTVVHAVPFRPLAPHDREVLLYPDAVPDSPYADAGLVQAFGYGTDASVEHLHRALQAAGQRMGCDAVARVRVDASGSGEAHAIGVCVVWAR